MKILIFGLPGSGKTTYANDLNKLLNYSRINGDEVRKAANDWDFSYEGRIRQAVRIKELADTMEDVIIDFVAPYQKMRKIINPDFTIWMDTITESIYQDTNIIFEQPYVGEDFGDGYIRISKFGDDIPIVSCLITDIKKSFSL